MVYNVAIDWTDYDNYTGMAVIPVEAESKEEAIVNARAYLSRTISGPWRHRIVAVTKADKEKR